MSSNQLDPKVLVDIFFEAYSPAAFPRTIEHGRADKAAWILMFDPRQKANGFFLTLSSNADEKNRIWATPEQACNALKMNEPLFTAFAKACGLLPPTAAVPVAKDDSERAILIDIMTTELGTVSLEDLADGFQLTVAHRTRNSAGQVERHRSVARVPISRANLTPGIASGLSPLKAACEHSPQTIQLLFAQDQALDAHALRALMQRDIDKAKSISTGPPKKSTSL